MLLGNAGHQKPARVGRSVSGQGEADPKTVRDEAWPAQPGQDGSGQSLLQRAGERVLAGLRRLYAKLHLQVNEGKTAVASAFGRKFLGFSLWGARGGEVKRKVASKALEKYKQRIRALTRRSGGRSLEQVIDRLKAYIPGWKGYFQLAQTPRVFRELDEWLRHRLRTLHLKHWKRGTTMYRELKRLGASEADAKRIAGNSRCWWRNGCGALNRVLPIAYFDRLGVPKLA
ncbi:group II intron maturase-specific domain-containing protein [Chitinimonas arctica]|nr:group II intron maturase-specific domain-containing protein [Chitinimonas arctica]